MKKILIISAVIMVVIFAVPFAYAANGQTRQAADVQFPIRVNGEMINTPIFMVNIDGRVYVQLRALCNVLGMPIDWNDGERTVEITTEADRVYVGYDGIEEWDKANLDMTEETAVAIADAVFLQRYGKDFVEKTAIGVRETDDKKSFIVFRYEEEFDCGGDISIIIRKSDGKIFRIELGE